MFSGIVTRQTFNDDQIITMSMHEISASGRITDVEAQIINQAMQDSVFRDRLLTNPKAVLSEQGLAIPEDVQIQVLQETANQYYLILPSMSGTEPASAPSLSEAELEAISGGAGIGRPRTSNTSWTGCASGQSGCVAG